MLEFQRVRQSLGTRRRLKDYSRGTVPRTRGLRGEDCASVVSPQLSPRRKRPADWVVPPNAEGELPVSFRLRRARGGLSRARSQTTRSSSGRPALLQAVVRKLDREKCDDTTEGDHQKRIGQRKRLIRHLKSSDDLETESQSPRTVIDPHTESRIRSTLSHDARIRLAQKLSSVYSVQNMLESSMHVRRSQFLSSQGCTGGRLFSSQHQRRLSVVGTHRSLQVPSLSVDEVGLSQCKSQKQRVKLADFFASEDVSETCDPSVDSFFVDEGDASSGDGHKMSLSPIKESEGRGSAASTPARLREDSTHKRVHHSRVPARMDPTGCLDWQRPSSGACQGANDLNRKSYNQLEDFEEGVEGPTSSERVSSNVAYRCHNLIGNNDTSGVVSKDCTGGSALLCNRARRVNDVVWPPLCELAKESHTTTTVDEHGVAALRRGRIYMNGIDSLSGVCGTSSQADRLAVTEKTRSVVQSSRDQMDNASSSQGVLEGVTSCREKRTESNALASRWCPSSTNATAVQVIPHAERVSRPSAPKSKSVNSTKPVTKPIWNLVSWPPCGKSPVNSARLRTDAVLGTERSRQETDTSAPCRHLQPQMIVTARRTPANLPSDVEANISVKKNEPYLALRKARAVDDQRTTPPSAERKVPIRKRSGKLDALVAQMGLQ